MTTLDKIGIEAARDEFVHSTTKEQIERWAYKWADDLLSTADALSSLPAQAVGVKALKWERDASANLIAKTPLGTEYRIGIPHRGTSYPVTVLWGGMLVGNFPNAELNDNSDDYLVAPKAAAQADYEARILSTLVAPSQPAAVGEGWRELLAAALAMRELSEADDEEAVWNRLHDATEAVMQEPVPGVVTDSMVAAAIAAWPYNSAGPREAVNGADFMRAALEAALRSTP